MEYCLRLTRGSGQERLIVERLTVEAESIPQIRDTLMVTKASDADARTTRYFEAVVYDIIRNIEIEGGKFVQKMPVVSANIRRDELHRI